MSIEQIRHLQKQQPQKPFSLELDSGRIIQIYDPESVVTTQSGHGSIGILYGNGVFEVFAAESVVAVSAGVHPTQEEKMRKVRERMQKLTGELE